MPSHPEAHAFDNFAHDFALAHGTNAAAEPTGSACYLLTSGEAVRRLIGEAVKQRSDAGGRPIGGRKPGVRSVELTLLRTCAYLANQEHCLNPVGILDRALYPNEQPEFRRRSLKSAIYYHLNQAIH